MLFNLSWITPRLVATFFMSVFAFSGSFQSVWGQEVEPKKPEYPVDVLSVNTVIVDSNGSPIPHVKAFVFAMRCLEDRGSHYGWPSPNIGPVQDSQSLADGRIECRYPVKFGVPEKWLTACSIDITLSHPDFVPQRVEIILDKIPEKIALQPGCKVRFGAIDNSGKPVERFFPMIAGRGGPPHWIFADGITSSGCLSKGKQKCMLACPSESGTLFSKLFAFETAPERMVSIPDIMVRPGKRVFGKLPDNVPRPIVAGSVSIDVLIESEEPLGVDEPISWSDTTAISEDGTFEFKSVPGPAQMQVIAICRGWIVRSMKNDRVNGKTFDLNKDQAELEVEFEMEQTGDIRIELMSVEGENIVGAQVGTSPNKVNLTGGSTLVTSERRSIDYIRDLVRGKVKKEFDEGPKTNRHYQISDDEGMVTLRDIPAGMEESINVRHPNYDLPYEVGAVRNDVRYRVKPGETEERLLVLKKREPVK